MIKIREAYKEIDKETLKIAYKNAWSIENMEAHGAAGRDVTYIGSDIKRNIITDYFRDTSGCYWFGNRAINEYGEIVAMEEHIFGHDFLEEKKKKGWYPRNTSPDHKYK